MTLEVAVLVSVGRNPVSGRARRAAADARALELGLRLVETYGARVHVLHAAGGVDCEDAANPRNPAAQPLLDYVGMGLDALHVLCSPAAADPAHALASALRELAPGLVLTGVEAECGPASGCVPYMIADALDYAIAPAAVDVVAEIAAADPMARVAADGAPDPSPAARPALKVTQALPRGLRRMLRVTLPAVVTVGLAAPTPRRPAYARARRGKLVAVEAGAAPCAPELDEMRIRPARQRPRRIAAAGHGSAASRLHAATAGAQRGGRVLHPVSADDAANEILSLLAARGLHAWETRHPRGRGDR